ncbi:MAG: DUF3048 domain-containing protein [Tenericutes bacterium]|nr:DUF3048 domain-containing protein [Mycoplasmatota bacterium]
MKNKKIKKEYLLIIIVLVVVALLGTLIYLTTSKKNKNNNENDNSTTTTTVKKLNIVNEESKSRPYAIMINNVEGARKLQSGLQDAYMVYELMVEGGITRYLALFLDQTTERIGSIRSARHYYLDYALENDAIYVHHGYSPQAREDWSKLGVDRIEVNESTTGWRDKSASKTYEFTLFTNIEKLGKGIRSKRTERNKDLLLNYSVDNIDISQMEGAIPANKVDIKYSSNTTTNYEYDTDNNIYLRSVNNKSQNDYVTGKQLTVKNIIVYKVKYSNIQGDNKGRQTIDNVGNGTGYYISNGYAVPITWRKDSRSSATIYKYNNGKEIQVNDGNTFIQIMPDNQTLAIS